MQCFAIKQSKFLLLGCALAAAVLMSTGMVLVFDWPHWVGLFLFLLTCAIAAGAALMQKIWMRHREAASSNLIIEQEETSRKKQPSKEHDSLRLVQQRWKQALKKLGESHLKKQGNPRYCLPWYLMLGPGGSGKSTLLYSAGVPAAFDAAERSKSLGATDSSDWWFFDHCIVVDTAGRYAIHLDEQLDAAEWQEFITAFTRHRPKEPLNGLIVTMAADQLLQGSAQANGTLGRVLRRRIDELMRSLGVRFPVYVLVTKCDLIKGMDDFCALLPETGLAQPMGVINQDVAGGHSSFAGNAVAKVVERLRALRLKLLLEAGGHPAPGAAALFPEEFARVSEPLCAFMDGVFHENPYHESPFLRALYFCSGHRPGTPLIAQASDAPGSDASAPSDGGAFLHDLLAEHLPRDRFLWTPTKRSIKWRAVTGHLGLVTWVLLITALTGLLGFSFVMNMRAIREVSYQFARTPAITGATFADLEVMDGLRRGILRVEEQNRSWVISRFGLKESLHVEQGLKAKYCRQIRNVLLTSFDRQLAASVSLIGPGTSDDQLGQYAVHLIRRINILKACLAGADLGELAKKPQPSSLSLLPGKELRLSPQLQQRFGQLYLHYLIWRQDDRDLNRETAVLQGHLRHLLSLKGGDLSWLCTWVDRYEGIEPITLAQFWGGVRGAGGESAVAPSHTRRGMERLDALVLELEAALGQAQLSSAKAAFHHRQRLAALGAWLEFAAAFPRGVERLRGINEWQRVAGVMGTNQGPYLLFLDRLAVELEPLARSGEVPVWLRQLYLLQAARGEGASPGSGTLEKVAASGKRVLSGIGQRMGSEGAQADLEARRALAKGWQEYLAALGAIAPAAASRPLAFQLASQTFSDDPVLGKTPFIAAHHASAGIRGALGGNGGISEVTWKILYGPLEFLWAHVRNEAAASLQSQWEEQVVASSVGMPAPQAAQMLLGPDGLAWRFAKGAAAPFLVRTADGYRSKEVLGGAIPLDQAFFSYLGKGAQVIATALSKQSNYSVGIRGLPTEANADANTHPHGTRLDLVCAGNTQTLINNNYPTGKTFYWSPDTCGDVIFQVEVGELVLTKQYAGPQGFPQFLQDFRGGSRTLLAREFPGEKVALERMGVRQIRANYQFTGSIPVIKQGAVAAEAHVPRSISRSY